MHGVVVRRKLDGRQRTSLVLQIPILARLLEEVIELIDLHFARAVFVDHCVTCRMATQREHCTAATQHGTCSRPEGARGRPKLNSPTEAESIEWQHRYGRH
jgi:hypothetical protein